MKSFWPFLFLAAFAFAPIDAAAHPPSDSLAPEQMHMITYRHVFSHNHQRWSLQYRAFEKQAEGFVLPITFSIGHTFHRSDLLRNRGIEDVDTYALGLGFDGYEHLLGGLYVNLGLGVAPGVESIFWQKGDQETRFLIEGTANVGLLYVPFPDLGVVFGFTVLGKLSNSKALGHSIGFGVEVGVNF